MTVETRLRPALAARLPLLNQLRQPAWLVPAFAVSIMLALWLTGMVLGHVFLPPGTFYHGKTLPAHLLSWDGIWYLNVARNGYLWNPLIGELPGRYQNIDFYPLYPIIEWVIMHIAHSRAPALILAPGILFGAASVFAFHRLALVLLTRDAAFRATMFYAVWPATIYFAMGYPTGLINLCAIASLGAYAEKRFWRAAFWAGLGTAAAPTMVFLAAGLCLGQGIDWLRGSRQPRDIPRLIGFGLLSVFGLIGFIAYQIFSFRDPFAFIQAQDAWGTPPPFNVRLARFVNPSWYLQAPGNAAADLHHIVNLLRSGEWRSGGSRAGIWRSSNWPMGGRAGGGAGWLWGRFNYAEQSLLNGISLLASIIGIAAAFRFVRPLALPLAGLIGLLGFLWFIATTDQNITAAPRLIFPALMLFAGLGVLAARYRIAFLGLFCIFSILTIVNAAFAAKGYFLI